MEFAPSETVVLHPLRFLDPSPRSGRPRRAEIGRMAAIAAVVGCASAGSLELETREVPILALIPWAGRRLRARPGRGASWPADSLEEALERVVAASLVGVDLDEALRTILVAGGRLVPDVIAFVEAGLRGRGIEGADAVDRCSASEAQQLLADHRERDPEEWIAIGGAVDRALRVPLIRHAVLARGDDLHEPRLRRRTQDFLASWRRLNRNPQSGRPKT